MEVTSRNGATGRVPEQSSRVLCAREQRREHVGVLQPGHRYRADVDSPLALEHSEHASAEIAIRKQMDKGHVVHVHIDKQSNQSKKGAETRTYYSPQAAAAAEAASASESPTLPPSSCGGCKHQGCSVRLTCSRSDKISSSDGPDPPLMGLQC